MRKLVRKGVEREVTMLLVARPLAVVFVAIHPSEHTATVFLTRALDTSVDGRDVRVKFFWCVETIAN